MHDKHKIQFLSLKKVNIFLESVHVRRSPLKSDVESLSIPLAPKINSWTVQPTIKNSNFQSDRKLNLLVTIVFLQPAHNLQQPPPSKHKHASIFSNLASKFKKKELKTNSMETCSKLTHEKISSSKYSRKIEIANF